MLYINNIKKHIDPLLGDIFLAIDKVMQKGVFVFGDELKLFEKNFSDYLNVDYCAGVANGTDAIEIALKSIGIKQGDLVATVSNAGMYSTSSILSVGAKPFFMDISLSNLLVTIDEIKKAILSGVKAIIVTHLYGQIVPEINDIANLCKSKGVFLIEDCAQAHGANIAGKKTGTFGDVGCFSFYPTKNLGALGDAGAVVTNQENLYSSFIKLRNYGWEEKYHCVTARGKNSRLDEIQSAILNVMLPFLDSFNLNRKKIAQRYIKEIDNRNITFLSYDFDSYIAHLFVLKTPKRNLLKEYLDKNNIFSEIHYPVPDHQQSIFYDEFGKLSIKNTEQIKSQILTIPCYPEMTVEEVSYVIDTLNNWN